MAIPSVLTEPLKTKAVLCPQKAKSPKSKNPKKQKQGKSKAKA